MTLTLYIRNDLPHAYPNPFRPQKIRSKKDKTVSKVISSDESDNTPTKVDDFLIWA